MEAREASLQDRQDLPEDHQEDLPWVAWGLAWAHRVPVVRWDPLGRGLGVGSFLWVPCLRVGQEVGPTSAAQGAEKYQGTLIPQQTVE